MFVNDNTGLYLRACPLSRGDNDDDDDDDDDDDWW